MGNLCENLCKGKKEKTPEEQEEMNEKLNALLGIKKVDDLIVELNLEKNFLNYCNTQFDMKNLPKYMEDESEGLFSFDFVQKIFMAAFVWKKIIADQACKSLVSKRRVHLKNNDYKEYKDCIK